MIIKEMLNKKYFKKCIFLISLFLIMLIVGIIMLKYSVEGEKFLPFNLKKLL
jgi:hypothetical protein